MHTTDAVDANIARIAELFPNCVTETRNDQGKARRAIDFDQLRQELSGDLVEGPRERYRLDWPGKREALLAANTPIAKALRPYRDESIEFDTTQNLFIEGDNLDALKLLQESYLARVKMIYIDPPYNTGNDFIYDDDFSDNAEEYFRRSNQISDDGSRLVANTESNGRFHSDWLSMMYSRLKLARNLLRDDGILLISIDHGELANIKHACDEVFGEANFCGMYVWEKKKKPSFLSANMGTVTDYILAVAKDRSHSPPFAAGRVEEGKKYPFNNAGNSISVLTFPPGSVTFRCSDQSFKPQDMSEGNIVTELLDPLVIRKGRNVGEFRLSGEWRYSQDKLNEFVKAGDEIVISKAPFRPNYINRSGEVKKTANLLSHRTNGVPTNEDATDELRTLFGSDIMSHPKPMGLLKYLIRSVTGDGDIVMDFFAGSATTAHAVLSLNSEQGERRRYIMVQLPEAIDPTRMADPGARDLAKRAIEFLDSIRRPHTVAEISKERIRRAGASLREAAGLLGPQLDVGFRVLKIDTSCMREVYYTPDAVTQQTIAGFVEKIRSDRSDEDLLFQILLDWGLDLALPVSSELMRGKRIHFVDGDALAACFEMGIDNELIKLIAARRPLRAVFPDTAFTDDSTRINVEQLFSVLSPGTEVKVI